MMRIDTLMLVGMLLVGASICAQAAPARFIEYDSADVERTRLSGPRTGQPVVVEPGQHAFLYGLTFDEVGDEPCFVRSHWWRSTDADVDQVFSRVFNICQRDVDGDRKLIPPGAVISKLAVTSLQACSNNGNKRLKGVRLETSYIDWNDAGGVVLGGTLTKPQFARTNCAQREWKKKRICPAGEAAVGLEISHDGGSITGLGLRCARPVIRLEKTSPVSPEYQNMENGIEVRVATINGQHLKKTFTLEQAMEFHNVEGAAVVTIVKDVVTGNGVIETVRHYGWRNKDDGLRVDGDTVFYTASISKFLAGLAMAKADMMDHGPTLDRAVGRIASSHPRSLMNDWYASRQKLFWTDTLGAVNGPSMQHLLSHTAGLSHHSVGVALGDCQTKMRNILLGNRDCDEESTAPWVGPGRTWDYSGGGFTVAELALELESGRSAENFLTQEILGPYGMTRSTYARADPSMTNLARSCAKAGAVPCKLYTPYTIVKFAGGLIAHPEDYAGLLALVINDGRNASNRRIIHPDILTSVLTPMWHIDSSMKVCTRNSQCTKSGESCLTGKCRLPIESSGQRYGLGIKVDNQTFNGLPRVAHHGGSQPGVATDFKIDREKKKGIVIFATGVREFSVSGTTAGSLEFAEDVIAAWGRAY